MGVMVHTVTESHCSTSQVETSPSQVTIDVTEAVEEHFTQPATVSRSLKKPTKLRPGYCRHVNSIQVLARLSGLIFWLII